MRTLPTFLADYGDSHQHPVNQWVHFLCVPIIFFSSLGLLWLVPLGTWLGLSTDLAPWVNGGTVGGLLVGIFYLRLGIGVFMLMLGWFVLSLWGVVALQASGVPLAWTCVALWVAAWAGQFWGHKLEGKKPSFADDLVFLLVGPVFVSVEIAAKLGLRTPHAMHRF